MNKVVIVLLLTNLFAIHYNSFAMEEQPQAKRRKPESKNVTLLPLREIMKQKFIGLIPDVEGLSALLEPLPEEMQAEIKLQVQKQVSSLEETQLHNARSEREIENFLILGVDPNIKDLDGKTALNALINKDRFKEALHLITLKEKDLDVSSPDEYGVTPLQRAIESENIELVNKIIMVLREQNKFDENEITKRNSAQESAFLLAIRYLPQLLPTFLPLIQDLNKIIAPNNYTPLMYASHYNPDVIDILIKHKADPNVRSGGYQATPLLVAVRNNIDAIQPLIAGKADVNLADNAGNTPLHFAAYDANAVAQLIKAGANVNTVNMEGQSPLMSAVLYKQLDAAELLLRAQSRVNDSDNKGNTPLMYAVIDNNPAMVQLLLKYRANPNIINPRTSLNALYMAMQQNNNEIVQMLIKAGTNLWG